MNILQTVYRNKFIYPHPGCGFFYRKKGGFEFLQYGDSPHALQGVDTHHNISNRVGIARGRVGWAIDAQACLVVIGGKAFVSQLVL